MLICLSKLSEYLSVPNRPREHNPHREAGQEKCSCERITKLTRERGLGQSRERPEGDSQSRMHDGHIEKG